MGAWLMRRILMAGGLVGRYRGRIIALECFGKSGHRFGCGNMAVMGNGRGRDIMLVVGLMGLCPECRLAVVRRRRKDRIGKTGGMVGDSMIMGRKALL